MIVSCTGSAIIADKVSGEQFEIQDYDLEWQNVGGDFGPMGSREQYQATVEHETLGTLSWNLWEYPVGVQNYNDTDVGEHRLVQDFDYGLEHEEETDFEQQEFDERAEARAGFADSSEEEKIDTMVGWFNSMFEDPANMTPYQSAEGGYLYIWGGPYDASEELQNEFSEIAPFELIEKVAEIVQDQNGIFDWAPGGDHPDKRRRDEEVLAERFDDGPSLEDIQRRVSDRPALTIGTEKEIWARNELLALVEDLQPLIARAPSEPTHGGIGHNQPPVEFEISVNLSLTINTNISVIVTQAKEIEPDVKATAESVGILQSAWNELKDFVNMTTDQVKSLGSKALAGAIITGLGMLIWKGINWLSVLLGLPFF